MREDNHKREKSTLPSLRPDGPEREVRWKGQRERERKRGREGRTEGERERGREERTEGEKER